MAALPGSSKAGPQRGKQTTNDSQYSLPICDRKRCYHRMIHSTTDGCVLGCVRVVYGPPCVSSNLGIPLYSLWYKLKAVLDSIIIRWAVGCRQKCREKGEVSPLCTDPCI